VEKGIPRRKPAFVFLAGYKLGLSLFPMNFFTPGRAAFQLPDQVGACSDFLLSGPVVGRPDGKMVLEGDLERKQSLSELGNHGGNLAKVGLEANRMGREELPRGKPAIGGLLGKVNAPETIHRRR